MLIDWFTVIAQIVNFLILVWLLQRFLYGPITQAMAKREALIASQLADAAQRRAEAEQEADRYRQLQATLQAQEEDWRHAAKDRVEELRQGWLEEAKHTVAIAREQWLGELDQERQQVWDTVRRQAMQQLLSTVRQVLRQLANATLEDQILETFLAQVQHLPPPEQERLQAALAHSVDHHLRISSSFPLSSSQRDRLRQTLYHHIPDAIAIDFTVEPDLIGGIQLTTSGYRLDWNLAHYLDHLDASLSTTLNHSG
jgi:F-type H+-transporting ATPase subunit b